MIFRLLVCYLILGLEDPDINPIPFVKVFDTKDKE